MTSIWRNFEAFYYQRSDNYTSYKQGDKYEPNICLEDLVVGKELGNANATAGIRDSKDARAKLMELLGYGSWYNATAADFASGAQYAAIARKSLTCLPFMLIIEFITFIIVMLGWMSLIRLILRLCLQMYLIVVLILSLWYIQILL